MDVMAATEYLARSTTLTSVGVIGYIIIGGLAGWIGSKIVKGSGSGIVLDIVIGIVGALIGGFLLSFFLDTASGGWIFTFFTALLGSVILLWIVGMAPRGTGAARRGPAEPTPGNPQQHDGVMAAEPTTTMSAWRVRRPGPMGTGPLEHVSTEVPRP